MKLQRFLLVFLAALLVIGAIPPYAQAAKSGYDMPYYIEVDLTNQIVTIYSTDTDVIVRQILCSSGSDEAPTPRGTFYLPRKEEKLEREEWYYFRAYSCYAHYATRIYKGVLFHSIPCSRRSESTISQKALSEFGRPASHGCLRLRWQDAEFIALNCLGGTRVRIFEGGERKDALRELLFQESFDISKGCSYQSFLGISDELGALGRTSEGEAVLNLQYRLRDLGLYAGELSGVYDSTTVNAVRMAQYLMDTGVDGIATLAFQQRMYAPDAPTARNVTLTEGMSGPAVRNLQDDLTTLQLYRDPPDSVYDRAVVEAVSRFQQAYAYQQDGVASPELQKAVAYEAERVREVFGDAEYSCESVTEPLRLAGVSAKDGARLREEPALNARQLRRLPYGTLMIALEAAGDWARVRCTEGEGYVPMGQLAFAEREVSQLRYSGLKDGQVYTVGSSGSEYAAGANLPCEVFAEYLAANEQRVDVDALVNYATVDTRGEGDAVNLRQDSSADSPVLDVVADGKSVRVLQRYGDWTQVSYQGQSGYLMNRYLSFWTGPEDALDADLDAETRGSDGVRSAVVKCAAEGRAAVYARDADDAEVLGHLKDGVELEVLDMLDGWCHIRYQDHEGYMIGEDLRLKSEEPEDNRLTETLLT